MWSSLKITLHTLKVIFGHNLFKKVICFIKICRLLWTNTEYSEKFNVPFCSKTGCGWDWGGTRHEDNKSPFDLDSNTKPWRGGAANYLWWTKTRRWFWSEFQAEKAIVGNRCFNSIATVKKGKCFSYSWLYIIDRLHLMQDVSDALRKKEKTISLWCFFCQWNFGNRSVKFKPMSVYYDTMNIWDQVVFNWLALPVTNFHSLNTLFRFYFRSFENETQISVVVKKKSNPLLYTRY